MGFLRHLRIMLGVTPGVIKILNIHFRSNIYYEAIPYSI